MSRYKTYPEYEKSKLQWADRTPKHWDSVHLRWIAKLYAGGTPSKAIEDYWENGSVPWINSGEVNQGLISEVSTYITEAAYKNSSAKWIPKDALVMALAGQGKTKGMIAQLAIDATCNQSMAAIVPQDLHSSRYLFWWLHSNYQNIRNMAGGDLRDGLNLELLGDIGCPIPNVEEQLSIAAFLDHETAKIDALIEKQQRLIELLKEKRQAVISHAVTKGLNPNAPMKDSGVEWLGEVPAHWSLPKVKWFFRTESGGTPNTAKHDDYYLNGNIPWIRTTDLNNDEIFETPVSITSKAVVDSACSLLPVNSVLIAMYGGAGSIGKHALLKFESTINQAVCAILPNSKIRSEFLHLYVEFYRPYWMVGAEGTRKDPNINQDVIRELILPCPPEDEQRIIVETIKATLSKIDSTIDRCESNIELIRERRTALISAAVTGKIDVRDWQAAA